MLRPKNFFPQVFRMDVLEVEGNTSEASLTITSKYVTVKSSKVCTVEYCTAVLCAVR